MRRDKLWNIFEKHSVARSLSGMTATNLIHSRRQATLACNKVARTWYIKAEDINFTIGGNTGEEGRARIQHHLAVVARPNIVQQLFYYSKALVSVSPFESARDRIMPLFNPLLDKEDTTYYETYPATEASFVSACLPPVPSC